MSIQPVSIAPSLLPQTSDCLTILPLSDLHQPRSSAQLIAANKALLERIDYLVFLGDMVACYGTDKEYEAVRELVTALDRPYTAVAGNHEWFFEEFHEDSGLYGQVWAQGSNEEGRQLLAKFQEFWQLENLWRAQSHPLGHFVFLSLNDVREQQPEALTPDQLEFLSQETEKAGDKPLFIFCHAPLMLNDKLDLVYYEEKRSACIEMKGAIREQLLAREAPSFWMSGHIHLRPDHYLFPPYKSGGNVWQIHCPDSWGYGRWNRDQRIPQRYEGVFSRLLQIDAQGVTFISHDHLRQSDVASFRVDF